MRLEQSFEVPVPVAQAWDVLLDVERIAPCMPGATLTSFDGTAFTGNVKVKLGPVSLSYKGTGRFTERDEEARRVAFMAQGQDSRGAGGASARVTAVLHTARDGEATLVKVVADIDIAGKAAQFGRGMIADVSGKLAKQFADCLATTIAASAPASASAPSAAPAASAGSSSASGVDAAPAPTRPPLTPVFAEPSPAVIPEPPVYAPPTPSQSAPPEYHPLAMQEPPEGYAPLPPAAPASAPPEPEIKPESAYAYSPEPTPVEPPAPTPASVPAAAPSAPVPPPTPAPAPTPAAPTREAEPIDLLAVSGAKGMLRKAAPALIIVALALIGLVVWLLV